MPRYEFSEGTSNKFWEIELSGTSFTTTYGKIGSSGQSTIKTFKSEAEAKKEYDKLVAEKTKKGYELVGGGGGGGGGSAKAPAGKSNPELEKAIFADPYDKDAYSVYADWLQGEGDPRGELIALQIAGKTKAAEKLLETHADALWGPMGEHKTTYDGKDAEAFTWKFGFIHAARLSHESYANEDFEGKLVDILKDLLKHPSGRFLAELTLVFNGDPNEDDLQDLIDLLAKSAPASLRKIHIGDFEYNGVDTEISWYNVGKLNKLWKAVPNLTQLIVQGGSFGLGTIELPNVTSAAFKTGGLGKAEAKAIASATWPKIEHLEIWYGDDNYGGDATVKDVQPLLDRTDLKALRRLGLKNAAFTDELCGVLPGCKLVKQLTELDLSMGCMTDEGAQLLAAGKAAFANLETLIVSENYLTEAGLKALKGIAKRLVSDEQRDDDDPEYRHPAVGE